MTAVAFARSTDPETSQAAAESLSGHAIRASQQEVLDVLRRFGPMTDRTLVTIIYRADGTSQSPSGIRTRRAELYDLHLVNNSGVLNTAPSGRKEIIWVAAS